MPVNTPFGNSALTITKASNPTIVKVGEPFSYTIMVTSLGPDAATNVTVIDTLPALGSVSAITPSVGSCDPLNGNMITCHPGDLAANASFTITVDVTAPSSVGTLTNQATVTSPSDPNTPKTATATTTTLRTTR